MGLIYHPLRRLVGEFNRQRGTNHAFEDFVFSPPEDLRVFGGSRPDGKNTLVVAQIGNESVNFFYSRLSVSADFVKEFPLGTVSGNTVYRLQLTNDCVGSKQTLWKALNRSYGMGLLAPTDIRDEPLTIAWNTADQIVTVTMSETNYIYLPGDTISFVLHGKYIQLDGKPFLIDNCGLSPAQWAEDWVFGSETSAGFLPAQFLSYGADYTPIREQLRRLTGSRTYDTWYRVGNSSQQDNYGTLLAKGMSFCDGNPWTYSRALAPWNIWCSWCAYNGPVEGALKKDAMTLRVPSHLVRLLQAGNDRFSHVALLRMEQASNMKRACLVLHYND